MKVLPRDLKLATEGLELRKRGEGDACASYPQTHRCSVPPEKTEDVLGRDVEFSPYLYTSLKGHITQLYPFDCSFIYIKVCVSVAIRTYAHACVSMSMEPGVGSPASGVTSYTTEVISCKPLDVLGTGHQSSVRILLTTELSL